MTKLLRRAQLTNVRQHVRSTVARTFLTTRIMVVLIGLFRYLKVTALRVSSDVERLFASA